MARQWYIIQGNKKYGPYSEERMGSFVGEGRVKGNTLVWCQGMKGWARATDVEPFKSYLTGAQPRQVRPTITPERRGGGRKAAAGAVVVVVIVTGLCIWWVYPELFGQPTDQQPAQQPSTSPTFKELSLEANGTVDFVVDGDTIRISQIQANQDIINEIYWEWEEVRFSGGLDAPELENVGGVEAKNFVKQLIASGGNMIYLDLDNLAISNTGKRFRDKRYDRLLAVVYVRIGGKLVNVNAEVLRWGQANYPNHNWLKYRHYTSEFNPDEWLDPGYPYVS